MSRVYTEEQRIATIARATRWNKANREKRYKQPCNTSAYHRYNKYGLLPNQWNKMFDEQKGLCKMPSCGRPLAFVDHDHETNQIRALLCRGCNSALGYFRDNPQLMREAAAYVEYSKSNGGIPVIIPEKTPYGQHSIGNSYRRGSVMSEETRMKLSKSLQETYKNGRQVWNKGKTWSEETRKKMSASAKLRRAREKQEKKVA
jgi:Recombination endonuclease VII/NUMOD3 motif